MEKEYIEKMKKGENFNGFYFMLNGIENFIITDREKITKKFIEEIINTIKLNIKINDSVYSFFKYNLMKATIEIKYVNKWDKFYYNIYGKNFSGYGSENINDGKTRVYIIK